MTSASALAFTIAPPVGGSTHYIGRHQSGAETNGSCSRCRDQHCKDGSLFATALGLCAAALRASRRGSLRRPQVGLTAATYSVPWQENSKVSLFDRLGFVPHIRETVLGATDHIHVITGPRSAGKSSVVQAALEGSLFVVDIDCRALPTSNEKRFTAAFKKRFAKAAERTETRMQWLAGEYEGWNQAGATGAAAGAMSYLAEHLFSEYGALAATAAKLAGQRVGEAMMSTYTDAIKKVATSDDPIEEIDKAIETIYQNKGKLVIFIDELNRVQSKGKAKHEWRDDFTQDLIAVLIRNTKQFGKANVIIATSDQQYAALMKGKADFEMHCLGYMGVKEIDEFLKIDWEGDPAVEREEDRQKIIDSNGGFFPGLAKLRRAAKDGRLDETIAKMRGETSRGLKSRLMGIPQPKMAACKKALQNISKDLVDRGYASYDELLDSAGEEVVGSLVDQNLVQLRYQEPGHEGELWAPDLPEAARSIDVVTPYLPIDRKWLREL